MRRILLITTFLLFIFNGWGQNRITQGSNKTISIQMIVGQPTLATYSWSVEPSVGTSADLSLIQGNSANILWDGPAGFYMLSVQVTDGNGCLSEPISQQIEIVEQGSLLFADDFLNTIVCSGLAGNVEGANPPQSESRFRIIYAGETSLISANITVENPDGQFVDLDGIVLRDQLSPEITVENPENDKSIDFSVADFWENTSAQNVQFKISLINAETTDNATVTAGETTGALRTVIVQPKTLIEFQ